MNFLRKGEASRCECNDLVALVAGPDFISGGGFCRPCLLQTPIVGQTPIGRANRRRRACVARDARETTSGPIRRIQYVGFGSRGFPPVSAALGLGAGRQKACARSRNGSAPVSGVQSMRKGCRAYGCGHGRGVLEGTLTSVDLKDCGPRALWAPVRRCGCAPPAPNRAQWAKKRSASNASLRLSMKYTARAIFAAMIARLLPLPCLAIRRARNACAGLLARRKHTAASENAHLRCALPILRPE